MSNGTTTAECLYPPGAPPEGCIEEFAPSAGGSTLTIPTIFNPNPSSTLTIPSVFVPSPAAPPAFFPTRVTADAPPTCDAGYTYDVASDTCVQLSAGGSGPSGGLSLSGLASEAIPILIALLGSIFSSLFSGGASTPVPSAAPPTTPAGPAVGVSGVPPSTATAPITSSGPTSAPVAPPPAATPAAPVTTAGSTSAPVAPPAAVSPTAPIATTGAAPAPASIAPSITPQTGPFIIPVFPGGAPGIQVPLVVGAPVVSAGGPRPAASAVAGAPALPPPAGFQLSTGAPINVPPGSDLLIEPPAPGVTGFSLAPGTPYRIIGGGLRARQASLAWADQPPPRLGVAGTPLPGVAA